MNSIGTKATIRIAGTPNFADATRAGSAAASEYAGAVDATPMTTFDANDMAFFFSACVMSKRNVLSALGKRGRHIIVGELTELASRHNKRKRAQPLGWGQCLESFLPLRPRPLLGVFCRFLRR